MATLNRVMRSLADATRLRISVLLEGRDELCVCEIVDALRLPQYHVSRHLRTLRAAGLVSGWRQGRWMHYRLHPRMSDGDRALVQAACARARMEATASADLRRLRQVLRPRAGSDGLIVQRSARRRKC